MFSPTFQELLAFVARYIQNHLRLYRGRVASRSRARVAWFGILCKSQKYGRFPFGFFSIGAKKGFLQKEKNKNVDQTVLHTG